MRLLRWIREWMRARFGPKPPPISFDEANRGIRERLQSLDFSRNIDRAYDD